MLQTLRHSMTQFADRLRARTDSEHEQALLRIVIVATVFVYMATVYTPSKDDFQHTQLILLSTLAVDLIFAFAIFVGICIWPGENVPRRIAGMFADAATATVVVFCSGEAGVSMVGVYLFITFGNGFRYGRRYLFACQVLCVVGFLAALIWAKYWRMHSVAGWSLFIALVVLPLYVSTLLTRIQEARAKAEEANLAKSTFLANMSHEMRTPLNGIVGVVDLLGITALDSQRGELLRLLRHSVGVLRSLVDDVLDISKIEAGRLTFEVLDFDLHAMLNGLVRLLRPHALAKNLKFQAMVDPAIDYQLKGDAHHLRQVLLNLVGNAIKFTDVGEISLSVMLLAESEATVRLRFEVRDTGIGMSDDVRQRIFDRFVQADASTTRRYGGTGLGTTIAKQLVELMSGMIGVSSQQGKGSTFWFEIPLAKAHSTSISETDSRSAALFLADSSTATQLAPSIAAAFGQVETADTATALVAQLRALRGKGIRIPAVIVSGSVDVASGVFEAVAAEKSDAATAMIYLSSNGTESSLAETRFNHIAGVSRIAADAPPRMLRNAIHAAAAQEFESAQIIDLGQALSEQRVSRTILVAEDNSTNRTIIAQLLESAGHRVLLAEDGEEALDIYETHSAELAILDFNMPLRNGIDVTMAIRNMEGTGERLPIMIMSASVTPEARDRAKRAGADEFLGKPYEAAALLQSVDRLARRAARTGARIRESEQAARKTTPQPVLLDPKRLGDVERIAVDSEFFNRLLRGFHDDLQRLLATLESHVASGRLQAIGDVAHAIKGASSSVGANQLAGLCDEIDKAAANGNPAQAKDIAVEMRRCFERTDLELNAYLSRKQRVSL